MEKYYIYICLSIVILAGLVLGLVVRYWLKKELEEWSERALRLGMDYKRHSHSLVGNYRGLDYWIEPVGIDYQTERICGPRILMKIDNPYQVKVLIIKKGIILFIFDQFGSRGDEIGHAEFEKTFYLKSEPKNLAARILKSSELSSRLVDLNIKYPLRIELSGDLFSIEVNGFDYSMEFLKPFLEIAYDLKQSVEQATHYYPSP